MEPIHTAAPVKGFLLAFLDLYMWIFIGRILLSWLPNLNWYKPPFSWIKSATDPVLEPFRGLIPPIGMMDLSPIVVYILLRLLIGGVRMLPAF